MKRILHTLYALCSCTVALAQHYQVDTLYKTGRPENRINVVILGDGFMESEMPKFAMEARKFADFFRAFDPYDRYQEYFNFFAIRTPSRESGISNPGTATDAYPDQPVGVKDTFFGVSFGEYIHRLLKISKFEVFTELMATHLPMYDLVVVLANTSYRGGSGGNVAIYSLQEQSSRVGMHEVGHTLAKLADEYWFVGQEAANMTANGDPATIRWKNWLNCPPIGYYKYGDDDAAGQWYKPSTGTCLMESMDQSFCAVCREQTVESILKLVNTVDLVVPDTAHIVNADAETRFKLTLVKPKPSTLEVEWTLNGKRVASGVDELVLNAGQTANASRLTVTVFDSTASSRRDGVRDTRTTAVSWMLGSKMPAVFTVVAAREKICEGDSVTLTAYGCPGKLSWSTGEIAGSISVKPTITTKYRTNCKVQSQPAIIIETPVTVSPLPVAAANNTGPYLVGETIALSAQGGVDYEWTGPRSFSAVTAEASIPHAGFSNAGVYGVKVTDVNGCSKLALTEVKIDPILAVPNDPEEWMKVSPNPVADYILVETVLPGESNFILYDQVGRKVLSRDFVLSAGIPIFIPAGLYLYRFTNGSRRRSGQVVVR